MNYHEAHSQWSDSIKPIVIEQYSADDLPALSESWNDYTDSLCKDGELSDLQYHYCPACDDYIPGDDDEEREYILKAMGVRLEWREYPKRGDDIGEFVAGSRHYRFSIVRGSNVYTGWYSMGSGLSGVPQLDEVLFSILSDTAEIETGCSFEEWANDLGFDPDSRKAEKTFKACQDEWAGLQSIFGVQEIEGLRKLFADF